jgi:glycosyltransferase involved in cell wall biosynthesis
MDIYKEKSIGIRNHGDIQPRRLPKRSIQSYVEQNFKLTELIVVDDGSQDNTYSIVMDFMKKHDNIRYMRHTNRNISLSKNAGIIASSGQYITFLDSDDI